MVAQVGLKPRDVFPLLTASLGAAVWLCPFWPSPTPSVTPLLWGGTCLGLWLLLDTLVARQRGTHHLSTQHPFIDPLFGLLLLMLLAAIVWRSQAASVALASSLCLAGIGLAATLAHKPDGTRATSLIACGWLLAGVAHASCGLVQYVGWSAEPAGVAFGWLRQRNQLATLCMIALLSLLYLRQRWLHQAQQRQAFAHPWRLDFLCACASLPLTAALAATTSRAGLLELLVISAILLPHKRLRLATLWVLLSYTVWALVLPAIIHTPDTIFSRLSNTTQGTVLQDGRRLLWSHVIALIESHPWLGVGWRELGLALYWHDFGPAARFAEQADNAHNLPLHLAVELGLPFTLVWLSLLAWLVLRHKPWHVRAPEPLLGWGVLLVIGLHSLLEYPLWYAPFQIAAGLSAGMAWSQAKWSKAYRPRWLVSADWRGLAGIALIGFCLYGAFDYHRIRQLFLTHEERSASYRDDPLGHANKSWLFAQQVDFAVFTTTPVTPSNAGELWQLGHKVLHFSPEPLVLRKLIEAGQWLAPQSAPVAAQLILLRKQLHSIESSHP